MRKVAFVTGATRGIGKACALSLARAGYDIVVTAGPSRKATARYPRQARKIQGTCRCRAASSRRSPRCAAWGREALGLQLDILSRPSIDQALDTALATWGRVDVLVNNAIYQGPGLMYRFTEFTQEQLDAALLGTLVNQVYITRRLLPTMIAQGGGHRVLHRLRSRTRAAAGVTGQGRVGLPLRCEQECLPSPGGIPACGAPG